MADKVLVQIRFEQEGLNDALYYTLQEYATLKPADIQAEKDKRVKASKEAIKPQPPHEPTLAELEQLVLDYEEQFKNLGELVHQVKAQRDAKKGKL